MDELVDILDVDGKITGKTSMKSEAHQKGLFHSTVHIWFYTKDGKLLIQQRGKIKASFPLLWDVSVAGHVGASENITISAIREIEEEIGLKIVEDELQKRGVFKSVQRHNKNLIDCEFHHTFLCELKFSIDDLTQQESEVEALSMISISQFTKELKDKEISKKYVPHGTGYYTSIIKAIQKRL